ncbi:hypothetical protein IFR05_017448, partial [Cadophora sp. M221]
MNTTDEETTKKAVKIMERNAQLDDKSIFGRLSLISIGIQLAHLVYEECRKKGKAFGSKPVRARRGVKEKCGKWDLNCNDYGDIVDDMFEVDSSKIRKDDVRRFMSETQTAKDYRPPGNYAMRKEAINLLALGRKWALLFDEGGPGAIWFAASGPTSKPRYSLREEFHCLNLYHKDFINVDDLFYRGGFNEGTKTYSVELFTPNEIKLYITNRTIGDGSSGKPDWEYHNKPPIQVYETEIPELGKGLMATETLHPGAYVAEHAGVCKPVAQCTNEGDKGGNEKDRM